MSKPYYKTKESVDEYIQMAKDVNGSHLINKLKNHIAIGAHILELGTGPGTDWQTLNKDYQVVGSDFSNEFLSRMKKQFPTNEFIKLNAASLEIPRKFDSIFSNKVLHHLTDQEIQTSIKKQYEILNNGGIICHSFWKGEGSEIFKDLFVNYHSSTELMELFEESFEIILIDSYKEFEEDDSLMLIAKKK